MRNYLKEIKLLKAEVEQINEEIAVLEIKEDMYNLNKMNVMRNLPAAYDLQAISMDKNLSELFLELVRLNDICDLIKEELLRLQRKKGYTLTRIEILKAEYRKFHSTDFYFLADEIDIYDQISKEGYIIGIKF